MCFGRVPPEINSGRLFYGYGSASLVQAATFWDELAATLRQAAACCGAVTSEVAEGGQRAVAIGTACDTAPYVAWLKATATEAAQAATQAASAASAHELVLAASVPPAVISTNRSQLASLAATNCLAQASPAIADTEAEYEQMWADDAEAMYAYARASAKASALTPFSSPPHPIGTAELTRSSAGVRPSSRALTSAADVMSAGQHVMATIPEALKALSSSQQTTLDVHLLPATAPLSKLSSLSPVSEIALKNLNALNKEMMLFKAAALMSASNQSRDGGAAIPAGFGTGESIGALTVPARWLAKATTEPVTEERHCGWVREPIHLVRATGARLRQQADCSQTPGTHSGD